MNIDGEDLVKIAVVLTLGAVAVATHSPLPLFFLFVLLF